MARMLKVVCDTPTRDVGHRPSPAGMRQSPTRQGPQGKGLAPGFVTGVPGIPRTRQLKIIGNGVVPRQAATALRLLIGAAAVQAVPEAGTRAAA
jgi:alanine dehydrogenase